MTTEHASDAALRFIAMYSQLQETCDEVLRFHVRDRLPRLGTFLSEKLERLTDKERIRAVAALAEEAGETERFVRVPTVFHELKLVRDSIGHAILMGSVVEEDVNEVWVVKGEGSRAYSFKELVTLYYRTLWAVEQVLYVGHVLGARAHDGSGHTRVSGATLADAPPASRPPADRLKDPVQLWTIIED